MSKIDETRLIDYLASHPDFLTHHADELVKRGVQFPTLVQARTGANIIDITAKITDKARQEARDALQANQSLLTVAAENMLHWQDLHFATLGLLACHDLAGFSQMVNEELPLIFGLSSCFILMPQEIAFPTAESHGFITMPQAEMKALIGDDVIYMGKPPQSLQEISVIDAESIAILRLPDQLPSPISQTFLILGGKQADSFTNDKGKSILLHLSEMVGVSLLSLLEATYQNRAVT